MTQIVVGVKYQRTTLYHGLSDVCNLVALSICTVRLVDSDKETNKILAQHGFDSQYQNYLL